MTPDLLIVGGGIQGLVLLHLYEQRGGSALLVSRDPLGHGETLHSHGYLHRGYFLPAGESELIPHLMESFDWWSAWLRENGIAYEENAPILFDVAETQYDATARRWRDAGLPFEALTELPASLAGGSYSRRNDRRLLRIHDRLIPAWRIVEKLSRPLRNLLLQGEVKALSSDGCTIATREGENRLRPKHVVLATGRETQTLVGEIEPANLIRDVPMILIKGSALPELSGWFFLDTPITIFSHPDENGERMWVVTVMEGHRTRRENFDGRDETVDAAMIRKTLDALRRMVPQLEEVSEQVRYASYSGAKIDNPDGTRRWVVGSTEIEKVRYVWPVLWGSAYNAAREILRDLPASTGGGRFDPASLGVAPGVTVGREKRLSASLEWNPMPF